MVRVKRSEIEEALRRLGRAENDIDATKSMLYGWLDTSRPKPPRPPIDPPIDPPSGWDARAFESEMRSRDRSEYEVHRPPHANHAWTLKVDNGDRFTMARAILELGQYALKVSGNSPTDNPVELVGLHDVEFRPWDGYNGVAKWGIRAYNTLRTILTECYFHDWADDKSEHGDYENPLQYFFAKHCLFENLGGQALQFVNREEPGSNKDKPDEGENSPVLGGSLTVDRCVARNCGRGTARGSFPLSFKDVGRPGREFDITVKDTLIASDFDPPMNDGRRSHGGILVRSQAHGGWCYDDVLVERVEFELFNTSRATMDINGVRSLTVTDNDFNVDGGNLDVLLDDPKHGAPPSGSIEWFGNRGRGNVRHLGETLGPVTGEYSIRN